MRMITCFFLLLVWLPTKAQEAPKRLDSLFTVLHTENELNGNILIAEKEVVTYRHSFGYANVERNILNNASSAFHLASVSKIFTAVAMLQLVEKRKIKLDDPVAASLPGFPYANISIRQLLSHTSGLPGFEIFEAMHFQDTARIFTNADIIPALKHFNRPLLFPPGTGWSYSNIGYGILALLVEKISGMKFQDYLVKYVFIPAGMRHSYIKTSLTDVPDKDRTKNYDYQSYAPAMLKPVDSFKRNIVPAVILGSIIGPGNVVSTTDDLLAFDQALYGNRLLSAVTLEAAFTPVTLNNGEKALTGWGNGKSFYGLGWMILCDSTRGKVVWHSGGAPGMVTVFMRNISRRQTVIMLDNVTHRGLHAAGVNAMVLLNGGSIHADKQSLAHVYANALYEKGVDFAATRFNELKADTAHYFMDEGALNICGLELLWDGYGTLGLEALKLNTILYPNSWNVYDSYGKALWLNGKIPEAIAMYQQSISMNPENKGGKEALEKIRSTQSK